MERTITVNRERCIHCGMCLKDCPVAAIEFDGDHIPRYAEGGVARCMECQHCMAICPKGALSFGGVDPDACEPTYYGSDEELLKLMKSRRSVRKYKSESVPSEKIEKIRAMLSYPPTGENVASLHFTIVGTKEKMDEIVAMARDLIMTTTQDTQLVRLAREFFQRGEDVIFRGAPAMVAVAVNEAKAVKGCEHADPMIALSYLELYAHSLGLGMLWCDYATMVAEQFPEVRDALKIPQGYTLGYILLLGVPAVKYRRVIERDRDCVTIL